MNKKLLEFYMARHARCRGAVKAWLAEAEDATWKLPDDVKRRYPGASILSKNRVVFDLAGNKFRLLCTIAYQTSIVVVNRIGTHSEYDKWDL